MTKTAKLIERDNHIGGQAVIEGVMIKSDNSYVVCVRKGKGIITKKEIIRKKSTRLGKIIFLRGVVNLIDMLQIGVKSLIWSAKQQETKGESKISNKEIFFILAASFIFAAVFFIALPYFLTFLTGVKEESSPFLFNIIDGAIRITFFILYIWAISFMKDVRDLFQYHGAEHKAVNCHEAGKKVSVKNASAYSTIHRRCGTSFIMIVLVISIIVFSIIPSIIGATVPGFAGFGIFQKKILLFILRISAIPFIAGFSYELLKLSDRLRDNILLNIITIPGLWLQKITTKEPTKRQLEVAVAAVNSIVNDNRKQ